MPKLLVIDAPEKYLGSRYTLENLSDPAMLSAIYNWKKADPHVEIVLISEFTSIPDKVDEIVLVGHIGGADKGKLSLSRLTADKVQQDKFKVAFASGKKDVRKITVGLCFGACPATSSGMDSIHAAIHQGITTGNNANNDIEIESWDSPIYQPLSHEYRKPLPFLIQVHISNKSVTSTVPMDLKTVLNLLDQLRKHCLSNNLKAIQFTKTEIESNPLYTQKEDSSIQQLIAQSIIDIQTNPQTVNMVTIKTTLAGKVVEKIKPDPNFVEIICPKVSFKTSTSEPFTPLTLPSELDYMKNEVGRTNELVKYYKSKQWKEVDLDILKNLETLITEQMSLFSNTSSEYLDLQQSLQVVRTEGLQAVKTNTLITQPKPYFFSTLDFSYGDEIEVSLANRWNKEVGKQPDWISDLKEAKTSTIDKNKVEQNTSQEESRSSFEDEMDKPQSPKL